MGAKVGIVISILIVVLLVIISVLGGQDMEQSIKLLVNAITVIQQIVKDNKKEEVAEDEEAIVRVGEGQEDLTEEEIRELITKGL
jgi:Sec-independent protein translocase protein TatA